MYIHSIHRHIGPPAPSIRTICDGFADDGSPAVAQDGGLVESGAGMT